MSTLKISLRPGERIFVNGAVMRVDRKTQLELLNDVTFLLESHVMQAADTTTPLRQLYFIVQMMLIDPVNAAQSRAVFDSTHALLMAAFESAAIRSALMDCADLIERDRAFEALKRLRTMIPLEDAIIGRGEGADAPVGAAIVPLAVGAR